MAGWVSILHMLFRGGGSAVITRPVIVSGDVAEYQYDTLGIGRNQTGDDAGLVKAVTNTFVGF